MTNDFEVHERGTFEEIRLSRALAREIEAVTEQYGEVIPKSVMNRYFDLRALYQRQIEGETL